LAYDNQWRLPPWQARSFLHSRPFFGVRPETINKRIRDTRQLLGQAGYAIQPGPQRLTSLNDLYVLAIATGIAIPPEIRTAC